MTDKKKPTNVKTIRPDIQITSPEDEVKLVPLQSLIDTCKELLADAESGMLRELAYSSTYADDTGSFMFLGEPYNHAQMYTQLSTLTTTYHMHVTMPSFFGFGDLEEDFD